MGLIDEGLRLLLVCGGLKLKKRFNLAYPMLKRRKRTPKPITHQTIAPLRKTSAASPSAQTFVIQTTTARIIKTSPARSSAHLFMVYSRGGGL